jgi:photosystem II stability/assembly factor-like uncharacterized protein
VTTGVTARLRGLSAVSPRVVWASGAGGTVIRTEDGGATWARSTIPGAESLDFRDIDAIDGRTAYVLSIGDGDASRIYKTSDAGRTWREQFRNTDKRAFYDAMTFRDGRHGFAFSDSVDGQLVILRTDDGEHWNRIVGGLPPALANEGAFAASGTNIAIAGDRLWIGTSKSRVVRSTDNGRTWNAASTPLPATESAGIFSVAFATRDRGIVVGGDYKAEAAAVDNAALSTDGGVTWTLAKGLSGFRSAVGFVAPGQAGKEVTVAVGPNGSDYSRDGGKTWSALGGPGFHTLSIVRGSRVVWAAGEKGAVARAAF